MNRKRDASLPVQCVPVILKSANKYPYLGVVPGPNIHLTMQNLQGLGMQNLPTAKNMHSRISHGVPNRLGFPIGTIIAT